MKHLISSRTALCLCGLTLCFNASAQGYVSYNHDAAKMNQITVQEIGSGGLTPALYYDALHNNYQKTAAKKNKQFFRTMAGVSAYQQVDVADSIKASLTQRAEIEALNIADRQIDIAWLAEGNKINSKLSDFQANIDRIVSAGGSVSDKTRWTEYYKMYKTAIKEMQDAYMPNAQRKKQYLSIYRDIAKKNESLVMYISRLSSAMKTSELLRASYDKPDHTRHRSLPPPWAGGAVQDGVSLEVFRTNIETT